MDRHHKQSTLMLIVLLALSGEPWWSDQVRGGVGWAARKSGRAA